MSEEHITENLLLEVAYSQKRVLRKEYRNGKFAWLDEYSGLNSRLGLSTDDISSIVLASVRDNIGIEGLFDRKYGITVDAAKDSDSDTIIRVYALPAEMQCHRVMSSDPLILADAWLREFLYELSPSFVFSAEAARGLLPKKLDINTVWNAWLNSYDRPTEDKAEIDDTDDDDEFDWDAHHEETGRLELRLLHAKVIKAEIEAAEAIRQSEFYYPARGVEAAALAAREYLEDWG